MAQVFNSSVDGSEGRGDYFRFNISQGGSVSLNSGVGDDVVEVLADSGVSQVRLTFTSGQVGNGNPNDSNSMTNQDGGLAVRAQAEDATGALFGPVSRFDDEGVSFISGGAFTFDVRDLVSGAARGDQFQIVRLGTSGNDLFNEGASARSVYINAGMGNDIVTGSTVNDFLVGGAGDDRLSGGNGNDSFIGGVGNEIIFGGAGNDTAIFNVSTDGADQVDLGGGNDVVNVSAAAGTSQIRLTFTSAEVGNGGPRDSNTLANQDGGFAVRLQAEDGADGLTGPVSRYDDEGITFVSSTPGTTFEVRDLVSGVSRGDQFAVAQLGTLGGDIIDQSARTVSYYINAGQGADTVTGSQVADFLVGGAGNDVLNGLTGNDSFIGGGGADRFVFTGAPGDDRILDFVSGTDKIDLTAYDIDLGDISTSPSGANTLIAVDSNEDGTTDFTITLVNAGAPAPTDFLL